MDSKCPSLYRIFYLDYKYFYFVIYVTEDIRLKNIEGKIKIHNAECKKIEY